MFNSRYPVLAVGMAVGWSGSEAGDRNRRGCAATRGCDDRELVETHDLPKSARRTADNVLTMPSMESPPAAASAPGMTESDIARRAFELYCDRGRQDGHDVDDWLNAESELRDASNPSAA